MKITQLTGKQVIAAYVALMIGKDWDNLDIASTAFISNIKKTLAKRTTWDTVEYLFCETDINVMRDALRGVEIRRWDQGYITGVIGFNAF